MHQEDAIKFFSLNNLTIEAEIKRVEQEFRVDFGHQKQDGPALDRTYYPQFTQRVRNDAARMARNYVIFYCLENSIRELISQRLEEEHGPDWWDTRVPDAIGKNALKNQEREQAFGMTPRSTELIDFTTFGELGEIIKTNWDIFGDMFRDVQAVQKILATLNSLRAPIAHCKTLAEDEEVRLHLGLRDWFRQME